MEDFTRGSLVRITMAYSLLPHPLHVVGRKWCSWVELPVVVHLDANELPDEFEAVAEQACSRLASDSSGAIASAFALGLRQGPRVGPGNRSLPVAG